MTKIKACVDVEDCIPDLCLDIYEPSGHGRRKRRNLNHISNHTDEFTRFKENIAYSVIIPGAYGDGDHNSRESDQCRNIIMLSILLTVVVAICSILVRHLFYFRTYLF